MEYKINDVTEATITGVEPYGAFVRLSDGTKGLLHISEISYDYVVDIHDYVKKNSVVNVKIIDIVDGRARVSLKALQNKTMRRKRYMNNRLTNFEKGFSTLEKHLEVWIKQLEEEYESKI